MIAAHLISAHAGNIGRIAAAVGVTPSCIRQRLRRAGLWATVVSARDGAARQRGSGRRKGVATYACPRCGTAQSPLGVAGCCLRAPKPTGWCAWCGADLVGPRRVFCGSPCALSYADDLLGSAA